MLRLQHEGLTFRPFRKSWHTYTPTFQQRNERKRSEKRAHREKRHQIKIRRKPKAGKKQWKTKSTETGGGEQDWDESHTTRSLFSRHSHSSRLLLRLSDMSVPSVMFSCHDPSLLWGPSRRVSGPSRLTGHSYLCNPSCPSRDRHDSMRDTSVMAGMTDVTIRLLLLL